MHFWHVKEMILVDAPGNLCSVNVNMLSYVSDLDILRTFPLNIIVTSFESIISISRKLTPIIWR